MSIDRIRETLDEQVAVGRIPGYTCAVRVGKTGAILAGGRAAFEAAAAPMTEDTLFRIASLSKLLCAALTLVLVEDAELGLDEPVRRWLPELASPRVLRRADGPLDDTVPAETPITVRHLLTCTAGWGAVMQPTPLQRATLDRDLYPGALPPQMTGDEFVERLARLPLAFQPGCGWLYDTPLKVLSVLLARASSISPAELLAERITAPLGMSDTRFWSADTDRMATAYQPAEDGELGVLDPPDGRWSAPVPFEDLAGGLLSTAPDLLRFLDAMAAGGSPVLSEDSVRLLSTDQLSHDLRRHTGPILADGESWGLGCAVDVERRQPWMAPGRWGWSGGTGTTAHVDPARDRLGVLLTQRAMTSPNDGLEHFWLAVARA